jgi:thiol-disulfide isomerase/thioredoxin
MIKLIIISLLIIQGILVRGQEVTLAVGSKTPKLYIQEWIKGKSVQEFERGKVYLVEFSAISCTPCRNAIPHLSQLAEKYKEKLEVISIYTWESNPKNVKDLRYVGNVKKFIKNMGDKISFTVATDVPQQYSFEKWGKASGKNGIPAMFLVDESGRLVWTGGIGELDKILEAHFLQNKSWEQIKGMTDKQAEKDAKINAAIDRIFAQKRSGEMQPAIASMDSLLALYPKSFYYYWKFELLKGVDDDKAYECLQQVLDQNLPNYDWFHLIDESYSGAKKPNYTIAHEIADRAIQQAETNKIKAFALIAKTRIYYNQGDLQSAIECCSKALETAKKDTTDPAELKYFEDNLKAYKDYQEKGKSKSKS